MRCLIFAALFAFAIAVPAIKNAGRNGRIINGTPAEVGEFPYIVSITNLVTDQHLCSGFIYSDRWIVTAASCVANLQASVVSVTVGNLYLNRPEPDEETFEIIGIVARDDYNSLTGKANLAMLQLSRPITFSPAVYFLPYDEINDLNGSPTGIIMGWGALNVGGLESLRLLKTEVTLRGNCDAYGPSYEFNYMICAGTASDVGKPCTYDEGSPLVQDGVAIGILAVQRDCGTDPFYSSIYTRLSAYFSWMQSIAGYQPVPTTTTSTTARPTMIETTNPSDEVTDDVTNWTDASLSE